MKILLFIVIGIMICHTSQGQNVENLPKKLRDSILVEVANKAINKYSEGYLRPGAMPIIEDFGLAKKETLEIPLEYLNIRFFTVRYRGTEEEHNYRWYNKEYLVKAFIRADSCKVVTIRYIDDKGWVTSYLDQDDLAKNIPLQKKRFVTIEEREEERKRHLPKTIIDTTTSEYWRKFDERTKFIRDSVKKENIRKVELRRKAIEEQQKADSLKALESNQSLLPCL